MTPIQNKLSRMATGKVLIVLFVVGLLFQVIFQYRNNKLKDYSKLEMPTLDSNVCYDSKTAYELFPKLTHSGRNLYAWTEITVDLVFPIIYAFFLSLLILYLFKKCFVNAEEQLLALVPFVAMLFDYGENVLIAFMLFTYPQEHFALASIASVFTKLKWSFVAVSFVAVLFGLACLVIKCKEKP